MARMKPKRFAKASTKRFTINVKVHRTEEFAGHGLHFEACVRIGKGGNRGVCGYGRNPRKATGEALRRLASAVSKRKGSYAGIRR